MRIFTDDQQMIDIGAAAIQVVALAQPFWAATFVYAGALRGTGNTRTPLVITGVIMWSVVGLGLLALLVRPELAAIWFGFLLLCPVETGLFWWFWRRWRRRQRTENGQSSVTQRVPGRQ
jgi:Na+-driven multidrug efflux pump